MLKLIDINKPRQQTKDMQWLQSIPVNAIRPNPYQPRRTFSDESIEELSRSIREVGLLQPITVRKVGNNYELIAGERRLRAVKLAGLTHINAIVISAYEQESALMALIENLQRENLHFLEEAEGYSSLIKDHSLTQEELARRVGKNQSTIANKLRLLKLPSSVLDAIRRYKLTERHARALLRLPDERIQLKIASQIYQKSLSVQATEQIVQKVMDKLYDEAPDDEPRKKIKQVLRDSRLLINSMRSAVESMRQSGLDAQFSTRRTETHLEILVKIPI